MKSPAPIYLARQGYRRRRVIDAIRALPILGIFLVFLPLFWQDIGTAGVAIYVFAAWLILIAIAAILQHLSRGMEDDGASGSEGGQN